MHEKQNQHMKRVCLTTCSKLGCIQYIFIFYFSIQIRCPIHHLIFGYLGRAAHFEFPNENEIWLDHNVDPTIAFDVHVFFCKYINNSRAVAIVEPQIDESKGEKSERECIVCKHHTNKRFNKNL